jgi:hypothetical protein
VGEIIDYFNQLDESIDTLIKEHAGNLSAQIDITNYSPVTVGDKNPAFPPWNVIAPLDRAARVFQTIVSLQPTIFDNSTRFVPLGSNPDA